MQVAALQQGATREAPATERDEREPKEPAQKLPWKVRTPESIKTPCHPLRHIAGSLQGYVHAVHSHRLCQPMLWGSQASSFLSAALQRLSNGSVHPDDEAGRVVELQELLEKQNFEVVQAKEHISALAASVAELEEDLGTARKDLIKSEEMSSKYQRDLREVRPCPLALQCPLQLQRRSQLF